MRAILAIALLLAVEAAAQSLTRGECATLADMALTARALSIAGISAERSEAVMVQMYVGDDALQIIRMAITNGAQSKLPAAGFSDAVAFWCLQMNDKPAGGKLVPL